MAHPLKEIPPRPLNEREAGWVRDILRVNPVWRDADFSRTHVVAEGSLDEGISLMLRADEPENPNAASSRESVGNLWIQTNDGSTINVQLSHLCGRLHELYILFIDPKSPTRKLPDEWLEVSREAADV